MANLKKYREVVLFITIMVISVVFANAEISKGEEFIQNGEIQVIIPTGAYEIKETEKGHHIFVEDFGHLIVPGKPVLPARNFLIALPPGARVQSAEVKGIGKKHLTGTYRIRPAPQIMPVAEPDQYTELKDKLQHEWQENKETIYSTDQSYPEVRGRLTCSGTLRKYSYASVSFYPFSYHPRSGRLIHYDEAEIILRYSLPSPGSSEAQRVEELKGDTLVDEKASRLFVNYQEVKGLYQPTGLKPKVMQ